MATIEDEQKALQSCIEKALESNLSADEAASQVFETSGTDVQPDFKHYSTISCVLKKKLLDFLESRINKSASIFKSSPEEHEQMGTRTLLVLLKIAFRFYKLAEGLGIRSGDEPAYSISSLMRAIPFEMLQDIVNVTPIDEVAACVELLYEAMTGIERVSGVPCLGPFAHACSMLQSKVVESEGEEQLGKIVRWMFKHLPDGYKPALNIAHNINLSHPVHVSSIPESMLDSLGNPIDKEQYTTFWSLQHSLYDGGVLHDGDKWSLCMKQIECVLKACSGPTQVEGNAALKTASEGTVAYLSSPSLLTLQLQDVTFRRQQLVQVAMLMHYAHTCSSVAKPSSKLRAPPQKIHEDCVTLQQRVFDLLKITGSDGAAFEGVGPSGGKLRVDATCVVGLRNALQLETADLRRKADLTQPKQKPAANKQDPKSKKARSCMDTLDLTINVCKQPWSVSEWPLTEYDRLLDPACDEAIDATSPGDPLAGLQQESLHDRMKEAMNKIVNDMGKSHSEKHIAAPMFQWQTLRMLARSNLKIYSDCITERDADLQYAACVFLKDEAVDAAVKDKAMRYLDSLPPTVRERRKEARREKAQKKQVTDRQEPSRKRAAGHETDSGNASHGTPAKKARTDTQGPSKRGDGEERPAAPGTVASPLSGRSAGEIPANDAAPNPAGRLPDRGKDVVREPVSREAVRAAKRDASEKSQEAARAATRDPRDDAGRPMHADAKRQSQRSMDAEPKGARDDDLHGGARDRKASAPRGGGERHGLDQRGRQQVKGSTSDPVMNGPSSERGKGDGGGLPGPPPPARARESHTRAPLVVPRSSRMADGRSVRERDDGDGDGGSVVANRDGLRGQGGPEPGERTGRGTLPEPRRQREVTGGMRGSGEQGHADRDGDRSAPPLRSGAGTKQELPPRSARLLGSALQAASGDGPRETMTTRRGGVNMRSSPPGTKHQEFVRDKVGAENGAPSSKRARSDVKGDVSQHASNSGMGGRPSTTGASRDRYDRQGNKKKL